MARLIISALLYAGAGGALYLSEGLFLVGPRCFHTGGSRREGRKGLARMIRRLLNWLRGPFPQQQLTPADLQRLQAAEAKRQRRMEKRRNG